ncbi:MAG: Abi-alpha family protein [Nostoc sp. ChiSLP02]|nr:Abi-alpha family protein [Nostoc sp. DedSLP05]MDZ8099787.1 Abi-alpha family protein [Nostoc sp. DedSLP01]MDZ8186885.1 Abi-alpha family protein [Nostoc sp. ChiSLP02]
MDILSVITELTNDVTKAGITLLVKGLFGEQIEELGNVSKRKLRNLGSAVEKIYERLKAKGIKIEEDVQDIDPEILQPILEGVYIGHKNELIREKWINLLESAILGNSIHPIYIETLKLLDGVDANVLEIISDYRQKANRLTNTELKIALQQRGIEVTEDMIIDSLFNLVARELCYANTLQGKPRHNDMNSENIYISNFGKKFMYIVSDEK